jgi:hypothetical protein
MWRLALAIGFVTLLLNSQFIHAAERQLANVQGLSAIVQDGFCGEKAEVKVRTSNASEFSGDKINLQRLIGTLRLALAAECPQAKEIMISGMVGNRPVFHGSVAGADEWALKDNSTALDQAYRSVGAFTDQYIDEKKQERDDLKRKIATVNQKLAENAQQLEHNRQERDLLVAQKSQSLDQKESDAASAYECDMLAAHPNDPNKSPKVRGVSDEEIDGDKAAEACTVAFAESDEPRIKFQLGRAFFALGQHDLAADQLQEAADAGHAGAKYYLAALYAEGLGVKKSEKMATMLSAEAEQGGFKLPQLPEQEQGDTAAVASDVSAFTDEAPPASKFDASGFRPNMRDIIKIIYSGNFAEIQKTDLKNNRRAIDEYLIMLVDNVNYACPVSPVIVNKMWSRYENYIDGDSLTAGNQAIEDWLYRFAHPEKAGASILKGIVAEEGVYKIVEHDATNFIQIDPGCKGAIARFVSNVGAYMVDEQPITDGGSRAQGFAGSPKEPTVTNELGFMVLDYGRVPENFVPEIPSKYLSVQQLSTTPLRVKMIKENVRSLAKIEIKRVGRSSLDVQRTMFSNENPVAEADIIAAFKEGGLVMKCFYLSAGEHEEFYVHPSWFGSVPPSADPNRLSQRMRNHPMLVISKPRRSCMATRDESLAVGR